MGLVPSDKSAIAAVHPSEIKVSDLTFSQLTEDFIKQFGQFVTGEVGLKQSTCYNMIVFIAKRKRIANRNGKTETSLWRICRSNYRNQGDRIKF